MKRFRQWIWEFFLWRIEVRLGGKKDDARIITLANMLMDEVERQGYDTLFRNSSADYPLHTLDIDYFPNAKHHPTLKVSYICNDWKVEGNRTA